MEQKRKFLDADSAKLMHIIFLALSIIWGFTFAVDLISFSFSISTIVLLVLFILATRYFSKARQELKKEKSAQ